MSEWKDFREELMQNPDVKQAYDAHAVLIQRLQMKVTQKELAAKMSVPQGNISRLESARQLSQPYKEPRGR